MRWSSNASLILLLAAAQGCGDGKPSPASTHSIAPDHPHIRYTGRWNVDDASLPWVAWQGSTVTLRFRGSALVADLDVGALPENYRVVIDGVPEPQYRTLPAGRQAVTLASGLEAGAEHSILLMKETYAGTRTTIHGFTLTGTEILPLPPKRGRRIAFFGDSNMEGYSLYSEKDHGAVGTYYAYPATIARMLDADMHLQAVAGATLAGGGGNDVLTFIYAEEKLADDINYRSGFAPQVIVINAGANDISKLPAAVRKQNIKQRYRTVIAELRRVYGEAPHIILYNAYSWDQHEPANYSHELVDELGGNLSVFIFPWCWEQWHGDMVDHAGQAERLAAYIGSLNLGFVVKQPPEVITGYGKGFDFANGSFEGGARDGYGGFGWRYFEDGVKRVHDPKNAADGAYFIRLEKGEQVHQCVDASGDFSPGPANPGQRYTVTAAIRSTGSAATVAIGADFEGQDLYKRENFVARQFSVAPEWRNYSAEFSAPPGSWKIYIS
ncbi:MAG: hypothetical protein KJO82_08765, partial [Gammaproteobacteria bacterium]|nr:hypothetical protein [Gammaproteobacteria bacterium]